MAGDTSSGFFDSADRLRSGYAQNDKFKAVLCSDDQGGDDLRLSSVGSTASKAFIASFGRVHLGDANPRSIHFQCATSIVLSSVALSSLFFSSLLFSSLLCHVFAINSLADNTLGDGRIRFATFLLHILPSGLPSALPFLPSSSVDNRRGAAFLSGLRSFVT
jgi:hypothetical protein